MTDRRPSPLRFLAPVALVAFGLALFLIITSSPLVRSDGAPPTAADKAGAEGKDEPSEERRARTRKGRRKDEVPRDVYTVKPGDTLDGIAQKTGVASDALRDLNPDLDPQALGPGQKIKLRE
jgi:LysM repeat protein